MSKRSLKFIFLSMLPFSMVHQVIPFYSMSKIEKGWRANIGSSFCSFRQKRRYNPIDIDCSGVRIDFEMGYTMAEGREIFGRVGGVYGYGIISDYAPVEDGPFSSIEGGVGLQGAKSFDKISLGWRFEISGIPLFRPVDFPITLMLGIGEQEWLTPGVRFHYITDRTREGMEIFLAYRPAPRWSLSAAADVQSCFLPYDEFPLFTVGIGYQLK